MEKINTVDSYVRGKDQVVTHYANEDYTKTFCGREIKNPVTRIQGWPQFFVGMIKGSDYPNFYEDCMRCQKSEKAPCVDREGELNHKFYVNKDGKPVVCVKCGAKGE